MTRRLLSTDKRFKNAKSYPPLFHILEPYNHAIRAFSDPHNQAENH
jgi:hypothetical protein